MAISKYGINSKPLTLDPTLRGVAPNGSFGGDVICVRDKYVIEAGDVSGAIIKMGRMKKDEVMLDCILDGNALGASVTAKVGTAKKGDGGADDDDRFITATTVAAATTLRLNDPTNGRQYTATEDMDIIVTIGGATPTTGTILWFTAYLQRK